MPALAATDVTVVVADVAIVGRKRHTRGTVTFGDGALTYPTGGIPLPGFAAFGFVRNLETLHMYAVNERTTDYMTRYGPANGTLLLYDEEAVAAGGPLLEALNTEAPPARTYSFMATGW
jgi:hypothetical protein